MNALNRKCTLPSIVIDNIRKSYFENANNQNVLVTQRFFDDEALSCLHANRCNVTIADLPPGKRLDAICGASVAQGLVKIAD